MTPISVLSQRACACPTLAAKLVAAALLALSGTASAQDARGLRSPDLYALRGLGDVQLSPDGAHVVYAVIRSDRPGRPYSELWIRDVTGGATRRLGGIGAGGASSPRWSPDGRWIAFLGRVDDSSGVVVARADGSGARFLAPASGTNHVLPSTGEQLAWSPDSRRLAFVSSTPGPEADANGDPMVITRYAYKPTATEGLTRFGDNRRLHLFVVDVATRAVRPLTTGDRYEHSIQWAPAGEEILFVSNLERDADRVFNYDLFAVNATSGRTRQITSTPSAEYQPVWSPDGRWIAYIGTKRGLTSSETTMEDTHVWLASADGSTRRELGVVPDDRQGPPRWSPDGRSVYTVVQQRGSTKLYRLPVAGGAPQVVIGEPGTIGSWSVAPTGAIAYTFASPKEPAALRFIGPNKVRRELLALNTELLARRAVAPVDSLNFDARDGLGVQAFLTMPLGRSAGSRHPLVVMLHGGPHGQQGPAFNAKAQAYSAHGYAVLMVNYRGSTGYGQRFADAIFKDQNGREAGDVLAGVDAALARHPWIDGDRIGVEGGSYGGQLAEWLVTRTDRFRAAIPLAGIANLVSFNYMAYYHDYLAVEFGSYPHEGALMDTLWARSALRHVARVKTPTMLVHGENDNDVPIAEAEQFYIALRDVGVDAVMVRYPREGHGLRETAHVVDLVDRSIAWYDRWFAEARRAASSTGTR